MGDFDSELYNTANYTYNETVAIHELLKEVNKNLRGILTEIQELRKDLRAK